MGLVLIEQSLKISRKMNKGRPLKNSWKPRKHCVFKPVCCKFNNESTSQKKINC